MLLKPKGLLSPLQKKFLTTFATLPDQENFYLAGGSALAEFYLGHRLSKDLDIFTGQDGLVLPISYQIEAACAKQNIQITTTRRFASSAQFILTGEDETQKVDVAFDSPFRLEPPALTEYGVMVNDFTDLKADKVLAYFGRAEPRDAIDVYFFMRDEPIENLIALAAQKDPGFDLYWFAVSLNRAASFPDELERWPVTMLEPFSPIDLKQKFKQIAMDILSRLTQK